MSQSIAEGMVVGYRFTMIRREDGEELGGSPDGETDFYLHGAENIPPGLEAGLEGHKVGDKFQIDVDAAEGFGDRQDIEPIQVERSQFGEGDELEVGASVVAESDDGEPFLLFVVDFDDDKVVLDPNHPLAGVDLRFDVEVVSVRDAQGVQLK